MQWGARGAERKAENRIEKRQLRIDNSELHNMNEWVIDQNKIAMI